MGWFKKAFGSDFSRMISPDNYTPSYVEKTFYPESGTVGDLVHMATTTEGGVKRTPSDPSNPDVPPTSAKMTDEEANSEAMKKLFRLGLYVAPIFGGATSPLGGQKLFGN